MDHTAILKTIRDGDGKRAEQLSRCHIKAMCKSSIVRGAAVGGDVVVG